MYTINIRAGNTQRDIRQNNYTYLCPESGLQTIIFGKLSYLTYTRRFSTGTLWTAVKINLVILSLLHRLDREMSPSNKKFVFFDVKRFLALLGVNECNK